MREPPRLARASDPEGDCRNANRPTVVGRAVNWSGSGSNSVLLASLCIHTIGHATELGIRSIPNRNQ